MKKIFFVLIAILTLTIPGVAEMNLKNGITKTLGAPTRGATDEKKISLVFTGGSYGEGCGVILDTLKKHQAPGSFFFTGDFFRTEEFEPCIRRIVEQGHYLGPHSDGHLLYCPWEDRSKTLVTEEEFKEDLRKNIEDVKKFGGLKEGQTVWFIPPYEWYNRDQVEWAGEMGIILFNFTPGSGSNRDWIPEDHKSFQSSEEIEEGVLEYEQEQAAGLNGFLMLLHVGSLRQDKMHDRFEGLITELENRGYEFVTLDEMLLE
jgi:peptidoglycan/xylan/chitin deacetylase (PgdA/CDA1 family)